MTSARGRTGALGGMGRTGHRTAILASFPCTSAAPARTALPLAKRKPFVSHFPPTRPLAPSSDTGSTSSLLHVGIHIRRMQLAGKKGQCILLSLPLSHSHCRAPSPSVRGVPFPPSPISHWIYDPRDRRMHSVEPPSGIAATLSSLFCAVLDTYVQ
ncbi:hypothetical protein B0H13DRAFT_2512134 [Mycena leptocephala]|nr:hypothetical protein B0H13DRAFT_2512134 [Mycena leptocephala]